ncbi:MAG: SDR family NAD(P)-dependent oxidoreductase [Burkholderiales bacterium]|nr:SDR family NAD(P)-dependent oxidoreductase [Burkholderiales bacterium]MDE2452664.1 SDR family NAD(P)-dependent oxidoreductase [Burkholderiales bacterium]
MSPTQPAALIIGAGPGISGAFAAELARAGYAVALASRDRARTAALAQPLGARAYAADASQPEQIVQLFEAVERDLGAPEVVLYNPSSRVRGELLSLDLGQAQAAIQTTAIGALATAQEAARRMLPKGRGALFFTGATAGVKGFARSSVFAMGKFALRGLAQSLAKELGPAGIHVVHFVIDGAVVPDAGVGHAFTAASIAQSYMAALAQPPGAWSWELELRSQVEPF